MQITDLKIPDVKLIYPAKFGDARGFFSETYNAQKFADAGIDAVFVQDNHSFSQNVGVLRGLHFQAPPFAQDKLVRVARGKVLDVAVDLRKKSATYGQWVAAELSAENWAQMYVPKGFAHGFLTLTPDTEVLYKVSGLYAPDHEGAIMWNDPDLAIDWPIDPADVTLSDKDTKAPSFAQYDQNPVF